MKEPCNDCPFRCRTFTPLEDESVERMLDFVHSSNPTMYCHKSLDAFGLPVGKLRPCVGFVAFRSGALSGVVFRDEDALARAHHRSTRKVVFHWDMENNG